MGVGGTIYLWLHCHHQNDTYIKKGSDESYFSFSLIDDLRKSMGLHSVSAYRHGLYIIQVQACGCSAE